MEWENIGEIIQLQGARNRNNNRQMRPICKHTNATKSAIGPGRVGAQSRLGPSPGWGPVRVGAHMGPYGPLCFFEKGYVSGSDGSV